MKQNTDWLRFISITIAFGTVLYLSHIFADEPYVESNSVRADTKAERHARAPAYLQSDSKTQPHARSSLYLQPDQKTIK